MATKDVLIIGGGLGAISAAISLAGEKYTVKLYEKNSHLGGKLNHSFLEGFKFDLGPSILTMPHILEKLFQTHGREMEDYIRTEKLELEWKCFFEDGKIFDLYADPIKLVEKNQGLGKDDLKDIIKYLNYARGISDLVEEGYFTKGLDNIEQILKHYGVIKAWRGFDYFSTMAQGVERHLKNEHLRDIFNFFIKYVGSSPYNAPAVLNLLCHIQFKYGLWYVPGGVYNIARGLEKLMEELPIEVNTGCEVVQILTEGKKARGIQLASGEKVEGDIIISNMEVIPAYQRLLSEELLPSHYQESFEPACSGYVLHLGIDREYPHLDHHNFFFSRDTKKHFREVFDEYKLPEDPTIYLVATTRTDPSQAPEGCENIKILPHIPHLGKREFSREDYNLLKERVLNKLERMGLKDLRQHIIVEDEWHPQDIQRKYYSNQGAIYGVVSDKKKNKGFKAPKKSEVLANLYFVGGSVNPGAGMPMAILSGQQVKDLIFKDEF